MSCLLNSVQKFVVICKNTKNLPCLPLTVWQMLAVDIQQIVNTTWSIEVDCAALCRVIWLSDLLYSRCFGVLHGKFQCGSLSCSLSLFLRCSTCVCALSKNLANAAYEQCSAVHTPWSEHVYNGLSVCMRVRVGCLLAFASADATSDVHFAAWSLPPGSND